jgi:L-alanine-DL-glutamate epimerase-like enolase superfamily enzyme
MSQRLQEGAPIMAKVEQATVALYSFPLKRPWGDQTHEVSEIEIAIVRLTDDDGVIGDGFTWTVGVGGRAITALIESEVIPRLLGKEASPRPRWYELWHALHDAGGGGLTTIALGAVDIALWDLLGKQQGRSLTQMLGACRRAIPAYGSGVDLNLSIDELEDECRQWVARGYRAVKIKVGAATLAEDRRRVATVRKAIGDLPLMVDANQGWDTSAALRACRALQEFDLTWVEEPLIADDLFGHARLRACSPVPIAVGENLYTVYDFNRYLASGACDYIQPDVARVGGITPFLDIAALAGTWNVPLAPHFMMEITGQLLCCIPGAFLLEDVEGGSLSELGALRHEIRVEDGLFRPPELPGHGVEFDFDSISALAKV